MDWTIAVVIMAVLVVVDFMILLKTQNAKKGK